MSRVFCACSSSISTPCADDDSGDFAVAAIMKDRDAIAVFGILEHLEDVTGRAVRADQHLAQTSLFRPFQHIAQPSRFVGQIPQIANRVVANVSKRQDNYRYFGYV